MVGNHLSQHRELSLKAIGLGLYMQSLPDGAKVGIRDIAARFPEGATAVASALRELETHGYLTRDREQISGGRWVTRTVVYDMPRPMAAEAPESGRVATPPKTQSSPAAAPAPAAVPVPLPAPAEPAPVPEPAPVAVSVPASPSVAKARPALPVPALPARPLPEPDHPDLTRHRTAAEILAGLRRHDPRLLLSERDISRLTPALSTWLERGVDVTGVERALSGLLPQGSITHPAALLGHRLTQQLPPRLPAVRIEPGARRPDPLQNCDSCDRAYRAPEPGDCPACRAEAAPVPAPGVAPEPAPDAVSGLAPG